MDNLKTVIEELIERFGLIKQKVDPEILRKQVRECEAKTMKEDFWADNIEAQKVMKSFDSKKNKLDLLENLDKDLETVKGLVDILAHDNELDEDEQNLRKEVERISKIIEKFELETFLGGKYDGENAIVSIHAGQGGTEALDWVAMLLRMYMRFGERKGWQVEMIDESAGEVGYKSVSLEISGEYAYGYLKHEAGTHRLVRQSPFNADNLRQTTFALVEVLPVLEENNEEIKIPKEDIEFEAFRSGGNGGQNVNKVSTAVRIKHIPSGIVVTCQTQRSQEQNRKAAMALLTAKLWEKKQVEENDLKSELKGKYQPAAWGTQIRSYVLHPYKMVKDLRTEYETSQPDEVLDGDLEGFVESGIRLL